MAEEPGSSQESRGGSSGIWRLKCNESRTPAARGLVAWTETQHDGRAAELGFDCRPQRTRALAVDDPDPPQPPPAALGEIVSEQAGNLGWPESMQVEFASDGNGDGVMGLFRGHPDIFGFRINHATKNPASAGRVFVRMPAFVG